MTFYVVKITDPRYDIATLPGWPIEDAASYIESNDYLDKYVPLTIEERKKYIHKCDAADAQTDDDYRNVYKAMKETFLYGKYLESGDAPKIKYSFWYTDAFDTHSAVIAIGADTVGSYDFNLTRIAKRLGSKYFYNFSTGKGKRFKDFSSLMKALNERGLKDINVTQEDLIKACNEDRYFVYRK